jgi:hypothetical protein
MSFKYKCMPVYYFLLEALRHVQFFMNIKDYIYQLRT